METGRSWEALGGGGWCEKKNAPCSLMCETKIAMDIIKTMVAQPPPCPICFTEICQEEFMDLGLLLLLSMQKETRATTLIEDKFPFLYHSRSYAYFSKLVKSPKFDSTIEIVLALNALVILVEEFPALVLGECCLTRNICF